MSKHTPGPWVVTTGVKEHDVVTSTHDGVGLDDDVCEVYGGNDDDVSVRRANARLIAAAPDLLAVLRHLSNAYDGLDEHWKHSLHPEDVAMIRAAIARAVGPASQATGGDHE